ncbi:MAG: hypothetical protein ABIF82_01990 [Planctomycetota bacterium]
MADKRASENPMSPEATQAKKKARWYWRVARTTLVLLLLAAAYGAYRWYWTAQVNARLDAIRAAGYPVTHEELDAWYEEPPPGQNAASLYIEAFLHYIKIAEENKNQLPIIGDAEAPKGGAPLTEETRKLILAHLAANEKALDLLHEASAVSPCRYPATLAPGAREAIDHMANATDLAELLILDIQSPFSATKRVSRTPCFIAPEQRMLWRPQIGGMRNDRA